jgi:hypothetical protein
VAKPSKVAWRRGLRIGSDDADDDEVDDKEVGSLPPPPLSQCTSLSSKLRTLLVRVIIEVCAASEDGKEKEVEVEVGEEEGDRDADGQKEGGG